MGVWVVHWGLGVLRRVIVVMDAGLTFGTAIKSSVVLMVESTAESFRVGRL